MCCNHLKREGSVITQAAFVVWLDGMLGRSQDDLLRGGAEKRKKHASDIPQPKGHTQHQRIAQCTGATKQDVSELTDHADDIVSMLRAYPTFLALSFHKYKPVTTLPVGKHTEAHAASLQALQAMEPAAVQYPERLQHNPKQMVW